MVPKRAVGGFKVMSSAGGNRQIAGAIRAGWWKPFLLCAVAALLLASNSSGHSWGGDFSQYVHHAINIVEGRAYTDTGHIRNLTVFAGPHAYPPVFPLVLAPVYSLFGLDWFALKGVVVVCFCLSLYVITLLGGKRLGKTHQAGLIMVLAFNPYLWAANDKIMADFPFLLLCLLTLAVLNRWFVAEPLQGRDRWCNSPGIAVALGLLLYLCYATREIGLVLVPTVLCYELFHFRKIRRVTGVALVVFLVLSVLQQAVLEDATVDMVKQQRIAEFSEKHGVARVPLSHLKSVRENLSPANVVRQVRRYAGETRGFWPAGDNVTIKIAGWAAFSLAFVFASVAFVRAVISGPGMLELFVAGYLAILVIFAGYQGLRYLLPVIPVFFLYAFKLHSELMSSRYRGIMISVAVLFVTATTASYASGFRDYSNKTHRGITDAQAEMFFDYVRNETPGNSIFVFQKPRVLSLMTDRTASAWPVRDKQDLLLEYMNTIGAGYFVVSDIDWDGNARPVQTPPGLSARLMLGYSNEYFQVYKLDADDI